MAATAKSDPERILKWTLPRSSSAFLMKCFSYVTQVQIINEPHNSAMTFGPEGFRKTGHVNGIKEFGDFIDKVRTEIEKNADKYSHGVNDDECTYDWMKNTLEGDWPGKRWFSVKSLSNQYPLRWTKFRTVTRILSSFAIQQKCFWKTERVQWKTCHQMQQPNST